MRTRTGSRARRGADRAGLVGLPDRRSSDELGFDELAGDEPGEPVEHEVGTVPLPARSDAGWLWRVLVLGLVVILAVSLAGIIWTVGDGNDRTSPDVIVTIFSSTLAGLIGLFVRAPA